MRGHNMSGIYIPGMEMPTENELTYLAVIHACGAVEYNKHQGEGWQTGKALSVHAHGELIDREELLEIIRDYLDEYGLLDENGMHNAKWCAMKEAEDVIMAAPTIIPPEEGE